MKGVINTTTLAVYHMRRQQQSQGDSSKGSVVITCSVAGIQRFRAVDYGTAKHAVLGFMRGMKQLLAEHDVPVRVNAIAPSWTRTGVVPEAVMKQLGVSLQEPSAAGRAAAGLMADAARDGQMVHVADGRYREIEEAVLLPASNAIVPESGELEDTTLRKMMQVMNGVYKDKV